MVDTGTTPEECAALQKQCQALTLDIAKGETRSARLSQDAAAIAAEGHSESSAITDLALAVRHRWERLRTAARERTAALQQAYELLRFHRDADETMDWIGEKERELGVVDLGKDQPSVEALQRKHEALERDLEALGTKLEAVFAEAGRLVAQLPNQAKPITQKQNAMAAHWEDMQDRAAARKHALLEARAFFKFHADAQETLAWLLRCATSILAVEPPSDVTDAESRLEQHFELRVQLDAQQPSIELLLGTGQALVRQRHVRAAEVTALLAELKEAQASLRLLWVEHHELRREAIFVQEFHRDAADCEAWLVAHDAFLRSTETSATADGIALMLKKLADFEQSIVAREEQVGRVERVATALEQELASGELTQPLYRRFGSGGDGARRPSMLEKTRRRSTLDHGLSPSAAAANRAQRARLGQQQHASPPGATDNFNPNGNPIGDGKLNPNRALAAARRTLPPIAAGDATATVTAPGATAATAVTAVTAGRIGSSSAAAAAASRDVGAEQTAATSITAPASPPAVTALEEEPVGGQRESVVGDAASGAPVYNSIYQSDVPPPAAADRRQHSSVAPTHFTSTRTLPQAHLPPQPLDNQPPVTRSAANITPSTPHHESSAASVTAVPAPLSAVVTDLNDPLADTASQKPPVILSALAGASTPPPISPEAGGGSGVQDASRHQGGHDERSEASNRHDEWSKGETSEGDDGEMSDGDGSMPAAAPPPPPPPLEFAGELANADASDDEDDWEAEML